MSGTSFKSFYGNAQIKEDLLLSVKHWINDGELEPGFATEENPSELLLCLAGKGNRVRSEEISEATSEKTGLPEWLVLLYAGIFERLPDEAAKAWSVLFIEHMPVGVEMAWSLYPFMAALLLDDAVGGLEYCKNCPEATEMLLSLANIYQQISSEQHLLSAKTEIEKVSDRVERLEARLVNIKPRALPEREGITFAEFIKIQRVLFAINYAVEKRPLGVVICLASAMTEVLGRWQTRRVLLTNGRSFLTGNYEISLGFSGFSLLSEKEDSYMKIAACILSWMACHLADRQVSPGFFEKKLKTGLIEVKGKQEDGYGSLVLTTNTRIPDRLKRVFYHFSLLAVSLTLNALGYIVVLLSWFAIFKTWEYFPHYWSVLSVNLACIFAARVMIKTSRRFSGGYGWYRLMDSKKKPVVYLRGFEDDFLQDPGESAAWSDFSKVGRTVEERMVEALSAIGPVVAFGRPGSKLPTPGAAKISIAEENWRADILRILEYAALVVAMPGYNENSKWEIEQIGKLVDPQKVIIYVPPAKARQYVYYVDSNARFVSDGSIEYYTYLQELFDARLGSSGNNFSFESRFIWFSPKWRCRPLHTVEDADWHPFRYDHLVAELLPVMRYFSVKNRSPVTGILLKTGTLLLTCIFLLWVILKLATHFFNL